MALAAPRMARPVPKPAQPVIHAGYFNAVSGLGMAARRLQAALVAAGLEPVSADLTGPLRQGPPSARPVVPAGPGTILVHVNGPMLPWALAVLGRRAVTGKRVIGVWNWELPVLPADWQPGFAHCHAIWASSSFSADAFTRSGKDISAMAAARPNVVVLDRTLADADLSALILCCDLLVSLHRAEGFGFTLAEALALGRPVVATGWSGNADFMQVPGAHPVSFSLRAARDAQATYDVPGAQWAEPDTFAAAALMRAIAANPEAHRPPPHVFPAPDYHALLRLREGEPDAGR
jgi:glycosyltransferase involved in cell wall biosynthesis